MRARTFCDGGVTDLLRDATVPATPISFVVDQCFGDLGQFVAGYSCAWQ